MERPVFKAALRVLMKPDYLHDGEAWNQNPSRLVSEAEFNASNAFPYTFLIVEDKNGHLIWYYDNLNEATKEDIGILLYSTTPYGSPFTGGLSGERVTPQEAAILCGMKPFGGWDSPAFDVLRERLYGITPGIEKPVVAASKPKQRRSKHNNGYACFVGRKRVAWSESVTEAIKLAKAEVAKLKTKNRFVPPVVVFDCAGIKIVGITTDDADGIRFHAIS